MTASAPMPDGLNRAGESLWSDIVAKYELRADELRVLEDACRERDLIARMSGELEATSVMIVGSMGQPVMNPLLGEVRQHRATFAALMRQLKLPDEGGSESGGALSAKNRAAAQARWASRGA